MRTPAWLLVLVAAIAVTALVTRQLVRGQPAITGVTPVGTLKEVMEGIVDPSSDVIFESVAVVSNAAGTVERAPGTAEEWAAVEHAGLALAEAANLVKMDRPVARPGETNDTSNRGAPELTPDQIAAKIGADRAAFNRLADALLTQAVDVVKAAKARNVEKLYDLGSDLDAACENCHVRYWYPDQARPGQAPAGAGAGR